MGQTLAIIHWGGFSQRIKDTLHWEYLEEGILWYSGHLEMWCEGCILRRKTQIWQSHGDCWRECFTGFPGPGQAYIRTAAAS